MCCLPPGLLPRHAPVTCLLALGRMPGLFELLSSMHTIARYRPVSIPYCLSLTADLPLPLPLPSPPPLPLLLPQHSSQVGIEPHYEDEGNSFRFRRHVIDPVSKAPGKWKR